MDNETKVTHTPGPWSYDGHGINSVAESHKGDRIFKTCLDYSHNSLDRERAIADSNLVAAAPELLSVARKAVDTLEWLVIHDGNTGYTAQLAMAKTAIAKTVQS